jgi:hypothetical protein
MVIGLHRARGVKEIAMHKKIFGSAIPLLSAALMGFSISRPVSAACPGCLADLALPGTVDTIVSPDGATSYLLVQTSNVPPNMDLANQVYSGWCAQSGVNAANATVIPYSTYGNLPSLYAGKPWDQINYILNNKQLYLFDDFGHPDHVQVQKAIWYLLGSNLISTYPNKDIYAKKALADAASYGVGFVPGPGQLVAVLLDAPGSQDTIVEVPVPRFGTIGDTIWLDVNHNGVQDSGEPGINGVTLRLKDASGNLLATAATATVGTLQGQYLFTGLPQGSYIVEVDSGSAPLSGLSPTATLAGSDRSIDSNPNPTMVTLPTNHSEDRTLDFGYQSQCYGQIGDFVWNDYNRNGIQDVGEPGIPNVTVNLYDAGLVLQKTTTTNALGIYGFSGLCAGTYQVGVDASTLPAGYTPAPTSAPGSTTTTDSNGSPAPVTLSQDDSVDTSIDFGYLQPCTGTIGDFVWHDLNRNGIQDADEPGIDGVTLQLKAGAAVVNSAITAGGGKYQFSGVCAGTYSIEVTNVPPNFTPAASSAPGSTPANDSNGTPAPAILAAPDSTDQTIDFGFVGSCSGAIGDFVWNDLNHNGIQDAGEPGLAGVTVYLRKPSDNSILATAFTDANGKYSFTGLCTASYTVEVVPPTGYASSPAGQTTPDKDSTPNPAPVTLPTDLASDLTIDFGFYAGSIGDRLWNDANGNSIQDAGEIGLSGWTVTIAGANLPGGYSSTQTTGANGIYTFNTLPAGSYTVCITPPAGWAQTYDLDGLATPDCASRTIAAGENVTDVDFGYRQPITSTCAVIDAMQGVAITPVTMTASGGAGGPYTFLASGLPDGLTMSSAGTLSGTPQVSGTFPYTVTIADSAGNTGTFNCSVTVAPPPTHVSLDCASCGSIVGFVGKSYSSTLVVNGGASPYTFSVVFGSLPPGLTLDASTGTITGTPTKVGIYLFKTKVVDSTGGSDTATCLLIVLKSPVSLTCGACGSNMDTGKVGIAYSDTLAVIGGTAPYAFSIVSGSLPPGLTLNPSTGRITGAPTTAGTYTFTAQVVDAKGYSDTATCTVVVKSPIDLTCGACGSSAGTGQVGAAFSDTLTVLGGTAPYTFSIVSGSLPPGLTLNGSTGKITGHPATVGTYTFTAKVVDSRGNSDTASCTIVVKTSPIDLKCGACGSTPGSATAGVAYSDTLTVVGGLSPYTFIIVSGSLPPGLTLNTFTGKISGTPGTAGNYTFTAKAIDSRGNTDTATCTISVKVAPIDLTCGACGSSVGATLVGTSYADTLVVSGGIGPYTFSVTSGSLPPGLTLNATMGRITGTPAAAGTYGFTVKVADSKGNYDTATCAIVVKASPVNLDCGTCGNGNAKIWYYYSDSAHATGGVAPYTYFVVSGSLPRGITLNSSTGRISGTPTASGTYSFTLKAIDSKGGWDTATCTIVVSR